MTFWYHMYGTSVKSLSIYVKRTDGLGKPVWTKNGNQANNWLRADVSISGSTEFNVSVT